MSFRVGIVGLPNVGKSTLFKALTKNPVDIANYPFTTIEPNVGVVRVPDERLGKIAEVTKAEKIVPTIIEFVDIAGLVRGAASGEGLGNQFLAHIREVDAIAQIVRVFQDKNITHVHEKIDPLHDIEIVNAELILADLETIKNRIIKLESEVRGMKKEAKEKLEVVKKIENILSEGKLAQELKLNNEEYELVRDLQLLTWKPIIYVFNISQDSSDDTYMSTIANIYVNAGNSIQVDTKIEEELAEMSDSEIKELGLKSNLNELIKKCYEALGLITFFTIANRQAQAWTVKYNTPLPEAGGIIHSDFQEKFIRADVIGWQKLLEAGSWSKARDLGSLRTEGKEYIVQDGDVIEFKI